MFTWNSSWRNYMGYKCKDCEWLCGELTSVGIRCMNKNRRLIPHGRFHVNEIKAPSTPACKSGFKLKER